MRPVAAPAATFPGSVAACLASILEIEPEQVPVPQADHPDPWTVWRNWLAQRGLGLVPVAGPGGFNWAGPWLAVLRAAAGDGQVAAVAFGSPPGIAWHPFDGPEAFDAVETGFVVAPADVALWTADGVGSSRSAGRVEAVLVAPEAEAPMARIDRAAAHPGRGLEGDRHFDGRGTFSDRHGRGHDLTLIEAEALEALAIPFTPEDARRNVVTRGIDLNALVGRSFRIGGVECFGQRLCEPCAHLERVSGVPGSLRALIHRGGLRADVVGGGEIVVGDEIAEI